ncbi:unnamed protein product [Effrenium voratum]|nr:unnamed protein product [Effrenium voratum]
MLDDFCLELPRLLEDRKASRRSEPELLELRKEMEEHLGKLQRDMERKQEENLRTLHALRNKNDQLEKALAKKQVVAWHKARSSFQGLPREVQWWQTQRKFLLQELYPDGRS